MISTIIPPPKHYPLGYGTITCEADVGNDALLPVSVFQSSKPN